VAIKKELSGQFSWPLRKNDDPSTVGEALYDLMAANGWKEAKAWKKQANQIAPTVQLVFFPNDQ